MPISKFGIELDGKTSTSEFRIRKIVRRLVGSFLSLNSSSQFDARLKRIGNVASPLTGNDAANKSYVDETAANLSMEISLLHEKIKTRFNKMDMNFSNITNLGYPVAASDAATKGFVDDTFNSIRSLLRFRLETKDDEKYYIIHPWGTREFQVPFNMKLKLNRHSCSPTDIKMLLDNGGVISIFSDDIELSHGSTVRFLQDVGCSKKIIFLEFIMTSKSDQS